MRLGQLQKRPLITEGWNDPQLTLMEQKIIHPWVARVEQYVIEADLTADQINQLFTSVEKGASDAGGNRTAIGKGVDVAKLPVEAVKWIDKKLNELGGAIKQAGPVENADQKFRDLKAKFDGSDNKVVQAVQKVSDWAKENPGKASVAVAVLTTAASIAGGPLGGAIAGFLARATKDLLQGADLSTAIGKSIKTAAYGAIAGWAFEAIGDWFEGIAIDNVPFDKQGVTRLDVGMSRSFSSPTFSFSDKIGSIYMPDKYADGMQLLIDQARGGDLKAWNELVEYAREIKITDAVQWAAEENAIAKELAVANSEFVKNLTTINDGIAALAQGTTQASGDEQIKPEDVKVDGEPATAEAPKESKKYSGQKLSEGQIYLLFNRLTKTNDHMLENKLMFESVFDAVAYYNRQTINEAEPAVAEPEAEAPAEKKPGMLSKIGGAIKQGAKTAAGAIGGAAKQITTKVTAEKLNRQWKEAGSPTDSAEIYDILKKAGVNDTVIKGTYDSMKIEVPKATDAPDGDKDDTAADSETNADSPTDSTAGDEGSSTTDTGAADTNAGGDDTAATDDTADDADALGKAKEQRAIRLGRGLSPEEEAQVEKEFNQSKKATANKNPAVEPGTKVIYKKADGKEIPGTTTAGDIGQYDPKTHVLVKPDNGKGSFAAPVAQMTTPDGKPVATTAQEPAAGGEEPAQTGVTDTDTASASGDDTQTGTTDTQTDTTTAQGTNSTATDTATSSNTTSQTDTTSSDKSATSDQSATSDKSSDQTNTSTTSTSTSSNQGSSGEGGGSNTSTDSSTTTTTSNQASANNQASSSNQASNSQQATSQTSSTKVDVKTVAKNIKTAGPKVTMDVRAALEKEVKAA